MFMVVGDETDDVVRKFLSSYQGLVVPYGLVAGEGVPYGVVA
jgi:hypothetical protein